MENSDLQNRFMYHKPSNEKIAEKHEKIRYSCLDMAYEINKLVPDGREKSLAITKLEEVMMWANAGIARNNKE